MTDEKRSAEIDQMLARIAELRAHKTALMSEAEELAAKLGETRKTLGNPYFYSGGDRDRPENASESVANFSGYRSHEPGFRVVHGVMTADRELNTIREQLRKMGFRAE